MRARGVGRQPDGARAATDAPCGAGRARPGRRVPGRATRAAPRTSRGGHARRRGVGGGWGLGARVHGARFQG